MQYIARYDGHTGQFDTLDDLSIIALEEKRKRLLQVWRNREVIRAQAKRVGCIALGRGTLVQYQVSSVLSLSVLRRNG